ncbi:MAG: alpha-galactosidase [Armatimonadota bacterium]|nr:MAG: alpha-galactosidase [Armatimonadota bacterium]
MSGAPSKQELSTAERWFEDSFRSPAAAARDHRFPISFDYAGEHALAFLLGAKVEWVEGECAASATCRTLILTEPKTRLELRCEVTTFADFPAVEWVAYFRNAGDGATPVISDIRPLDVAFAAARETPCCLHHALGSQCARDDFAPQETPLPAEAQAHLAACGGRSSDGALPFFNLEMGDHGVIGAIGWTGGWEAWFGRDADGSIRARAGMPRTRVKLLPGEEIRTPRILLLFWDGDRLHGHNMLRRLILAHHTPRPDGGQLTAPISFAVWGENTAAQQIAKARWFKDNRIELDAFWIDAGWYGDGALQGDSTVFNSTWAQRVGDWWPNPNAYPEGLAPIGRALREMGFGFVLWVEAERVFKGTRFTREHPEWLLGPIGDSYLFDLGLPDARLALTDLISSIIEESGVTIYRQDFNMQPAPYWEASDTPDRIGMSEMRHIAGLYAMWDDLLARHPGLMIDNCASGGRRMDLETISRSIPLWRSDVQCWQGFPATAMQGQTHGLALWAPLSTGCCDRPDSYAFRSALGPGMVLSTNAFERDPPPPFPPQWLRDSVAEQRAVRQYFYGDFHPLLSFTLADDAWAAWQFDRPDLGEGMVLALRREHSPFVRMQAVLRGLDAAVRYEVRSRDGGGATTYAGRDLMGAGIAIEIAEQPGSALILYRRLAE